MAISSITGVRGWGGCREGGKSAGGRPAQSGWGLFPLAGRAVAGGQWGVVPAPPTIVHLDADAFFVSCELARRPELRGRACAVGGRERGIIASASYEARAAGVYTPMPTARALRVCPGLVLIPPTPGLYGEVSARMFDLCGELTPWVERSSIDEGYLDLRGNGLANEAAVAAEVRRLQERLWSELGLPVSFGVAANKLVAQVASKLRKPRGFVVVPPGDEAGFLAPLPVGRLPGIGPKTEARLAERHGLRRIGELQALPEGSLEAAFGAGWQEVRAAAHGRDDRPVVTEPGDARSYSQQETFAADVRDRDQLVRVLKGMVDELLPKVRRDGKRARTLTVRVRFPDFSEGMRSRTLPEAADLEAPFYPLLEPLLAAAGAGTRPVRLVGVRISGVEAGGGQLELFRGDEARRRRLARVRDELNAARGAGALRHGHQLANPADDA
ncbi:MAG: DNA polymerase IV [Verrucomicrobia bacterium]|nr:DNA polymerase IV [Verrucomicrobiota bacterium]